MDPLDLKGIQFRRRRVHRQQSGWSPESWVLAGFAFAVGLLVFFWYRTVGDEPAEDVTDSTLAGSPAFVKSDPIHDAAAVRPQVADATEYINSDPGRWISKCRSPSGVITFRTEGCLDDERELDRTAFQTDIVSSVAAWQVVQADTNQHRSSGQVAIISSSDQDAGGRDACEFAKQERKSVRDRLGMNITYEGIQQLDEMVHHACK